MKVQHTPYHWALVAVALIALLLTLSEAHGQSGATAVFEGRPAMAGAQGGLGAQAGVPQGGIGVQGNEAAQRSLRLGKPSGLDEMRQARRDGTDVVAAGDSEIARKDIAPARDRSIAKDQRSAKKVVRAAKRTISRARHGTSEIDSQASAGPSR